MFFARKLKKSESASGLGGVGDSTDFEEVWNIVERAASSAGVPYQLGFDKTIGGVENFAVVDIDFHDAEKSLYNYEVIKSKVKHFAYLPDYFVETKSRCLKAVFSEKRELSAYNRALLFAFQCRTLGAPYKEIEIMQHLSVYGGRGIEAASPNVPTGKTAIAKLLSSPNPSGLAPGKYSRSEYCPFKRHSTPKLDVEVREDGTSRCWACGLEIVSKDDVIYDAEDRDLVVEFKRQITHTEVDCDNIPLLLPAHYRQIDFLLEKILPVGVNNHIEPKIRFNKSAYKAMLSAVLFDAEAHAEEAPPNPGIQRRFSGLCLLVAGSDEALRSPVSGGKFSEKNDLGFDEFCGVSAGYGFYFAEDGSGPTDFAAFYYYSRARAEQDIVNATNANAGVPPSAAQQAKMRARAGWKPKILSDMAGFTKAFESEGEYFLKATKRIFNRQTSVVMPGAQDWFYDSKKRWFTTFKPAPEMDMPLVREKLKLGLEKLSEQVPSAIKEIHPDISVPMLKALILGVAYGLRMYYRGASIWRRPMFEITGSGGCGKGSAVGYVSHLFGLPEPLTSTNQDKHRLLTQPMVNNPFLAVRHEYLKGSDDKAKTLEGLKPEFLELEKPQFQHRGFKEREITVSAPGPFVLTETDPFTWTRGASKDLQQIFRRMCCFRLFKFDLDNGVVDSLIWRDRKEQCATLLAWALAAEESIHPDGEQFKSFLKRLAPDSWEASEANQIEEGGNRVEEIRQLFACYLQHKVIEDKRVKERGFQGVNVLKDHIFNPESAPAKAPFEKDFLTLLSKYDFKSAKKIGLFWDMQGPEKVLGLKLEDGMELIGEAKIDGRQVYVDFFVKPKSAKKRTQSDSHLGLLSRFDPEKVPEDSSYRDTIVALRAKKDPSSLNSEDIVQDAVKAANQEEPF